jgi:tetratricopeptide (TPR) repeat protein
MKRFSEALPYVRESVAFRERALANGATDLRTKNVMALGLSTLGLVEGGLAHWDQSIAAARRGVELQEQVVHLAPEDVRMRDDLGYVHAKLGSCLVAAKQYDGAVDEYRLALKIMDDILAKDPGNPQLPRRAERAAWLLSLGEIFRELGKPDEAVEPLRECLRTIEGAMKEGLDGDAPRENQAKAERLLAELRR